MRFKGLGVVVGAALLLSACSSRPRPFAPVLAVPPVDQSAFDLAQVRCADLLVKGKLDKDGRVASAGAGAAAGGTAALAGGATAAAIAGYGGLAVAAATVVLLPFAVIGGAFGASRMKRTTKEKAVKQAMAGCLKEQGYEVSSWSRMSKQDVEAAKKRLEALSVSKEPSVPATTD